MKQFSNDNIIKSDNYTYGEPKSAGVLRFIVGINDSIFNNTNWNINIYAY